MRLLPIDGLAIETFRTPLLLLTRHDLGCFGVFTLGLLANPPRPGDLPSVPTVAPASFSLLKEVGFT